ncbi:hypothetical protein Tco_0034594, partial [Tanacetum coccineum]
RNGLLKFMKKSRQTLTFFVRLVNQLVDVGSPSVDRLTIAIDDDQDSKKRRSITEALEEEATVMKLVSDSLAPDVMEAHAAHNMLSSLHYPLFQDKLSFLSFDELVNVYDD